MILVFARHLVGRYVPGGWVGVDLFFALSGFLIGGLLLREYTRTGHINLKHFYIRRALRLLPALIVFVAVVAPIAWWFGQPDVAIHAAMATAYLMDFWSSITTQANVFEHTWSLAVEEQFYLIFPIVLIVALRRNWSPTLLLATATVLLGLAGAVIAATVSPKAAYTTPFAHAPVLLGGVALAIAFHRNKPWLLSLRSPWIPAMALLTVVAFVRVEVDAPWLYFGGIVALGVVMVLLVGYAASTRTGPVMRLLGSRPLVWLGVRSYGFYLWHDPVTWFVHEWGVPRFVGGVVAIIASLALTELSWRCVEKPFLRLKNRFSARIA